MRNMRILNIVSTRAARRVRVGTNGEVPLPTCAVDTRANKKVELKALNAHFSARSRPNQATNRGENSLVPNCTTLRTTAVTNPVKANMPLPKAKSAALALEALMESVSTTGSVSSRCTRH